MITPDVMELYDLISSEILDKEWLKRTGISYDIVKKYISSSSFLEKLQNIIEHKDFSCQSVLFLIEELLKRIYAAVPEQGYLKYIYQYVLQKSYPKAIDIEISNDYEKICIFYLRFLRIISEYQKTSNDGTWQSKYPVTTLTYTEQETLENDQEYVKFISAFKNEYVYEMMKLNQDVLGFNTLDHICGVHHIAMSIGRQLYKLGFPIDLGRISGAAICHDIGKYGCKKSENKRVPYLHYYYTDIWFKRHSIEYIGHIAVNHSTWDLELENLPVESLVLIYSDFRVKNINDGSGNNPMHIFTLGESFNVILSKLDNVDEKKLSRYKRVYAKLKDFEDFLIHSGVDTAITEFEPKTSETNFHINSLMQGDEIIRNFKYTSINHNINLMHKLRDESSLNRILEIARSEKDWKNLRDYLQMLEEYSTYLTQKQKLISIKFLFESLINPEDDIRRQCAELIGTLIATFDEDYTKEIPADENALQPETTSIELFQKYVELFLNPGYRTIPVHKEWIGYSLGKMISSLFDHCSVQLASKYKILLFSFYEKYNNSENEVLFYLLETVKYIPHLCIEETSGILFDFILKMLKSNESILRLSALEVSYILLKSENVKMSSHRPLDEYFKYICNEKITLPEKYIILKIANIQKSDYLDDKTSDLFINQITENIPNIYLSNLKSATNWIAKKIQVQMLLDYTLEDPQQTGLYSAMHLCNLIKVSANESVRNLAGEALVKIIPNLSKEQRNDVAVELLRALEIEGYQYAKYIPPYLGKLILYLPAHELDEIIDDFIDKIKKANTKIIILILKTVGITIANYSIYKKLVNEDDKAYESRLVKLLGILLNGLVHYNAPIRQFSFSVIGKEIFDSKVLDMEGKINIFKLISKKILTLVSDIKPDEIRFLTNSASFNHIYRFISEYILRNGRIELPHPSKTAFFPGAFDPFSLSHKEIAKSIRDLGFEVYLAVDEFSWSKQTLAHLLRKNIINMCIADELSIYLYPEDMPVNIANADNLDDLVKTFTDSKTYIVVGSDVVANASAYRKQPEDKSIFNINHLIFERVTASSDSASVMLEENIEKIKADVVRLALPLEFEDISSTQIRNCIDESRSIASLVDPLVEKYIYENGFYKREPQYKSVLKTVSINIETVEEIKSSLIDELSKVPDLDPGYVCERLQSIAGKPYSSTRFIIARDISTREILGFSVFHWVRSNVILNEFEDSRVSEYIRENAVGRIILIDGIFLNPYRSYENLEQIILTETIACCLSKDYDYAAFHNMLYGYHSDTIDELLILQGFERLPFSPDKSSVYAVNMNSPITINLDLDLYIKEPFRSHHLVHESITRCRKKLQRAMTQLYPGNLVLSFDINIMNETLVRKICSENNVPCLPSGKLGDAMCVPFGSILKRYIVPNTVTKSLHAEKLFEPDVRNYSIGPYPNYLSLENQAKMLKAFNRPVILVDDILHKGYRIRVIDPILKNTGIDVKKIVIGILSGRGKEIMDVQNREVEYAYFIPKLKAWFNENALYPFIGGDTLLRGTVPERNLIPSVNLILPYTAPTFIKHTPADSIYNLSEVCIENSMDLFSSVQTAYQEVNERSLTMRSLGEVFTFPKYPDHGMDMEYNLNLPPLHYLYNDLEQLRRLKPILSCYDKNIYNRGDKNEYL